MVRAPTLLRPRAAPAQGGFSLVELVVVIVITGVIASVVGLFITGPIQGFIDQARRAELVDSAQLALTRMGRDLRASLPNSVRINPGRTALEVLLTLDGDRYRVETPGAADDRLDFTAADGAFNTFAPLSPPAVLPAIGTAYRVTGAIAIYPLLQFGANPYLDDVMTPSGAIDITPVDNSGQTEYRVSLISAPGGPGMHRFPFDSPTRRVFLVEGPATWLCEPPELLRYDDYDLQAAQVATEAGLDALPGVRKAVIAGNVQSCAFRYEPGTAQRNAVVSLVLALADPAVPDERIRLIRQIHVDNSP
jgi:MSHA biogenesis protein MshO